MRGSAWIPFLAAMLLSLAAVIWPGAALLGSAASWEPSAVDPASPVELLRTTAAWTLAVTVLAMVLGWGPGRVLGGMLDRRGFTPMLALLLVPVCLPAYLVFWSWWQTWPAPSPLFTWAVRHDAQAWLTSATLLVGLVCWSWPIVALCTAASAARDRRQRHDLLRLDGAPLRIRLAQTLRHDLGALMIGGLVVALLTIGNTTSFDLAGIFTYGNELRAKRALGANAGELLIAGLPAVSAALVGAVLIWLIARRPLPAAAPARARPARWALGATSGLWLVSVAVPFGLLATTVLASAGPPQGFLDLYGRGLVNTLGLATCCAVLVAVTAVGLRFAWVDRRRGPRLIAAGIATTWLIAGLVPATLVAGAIEAAYNRGVPLPLAVSGAGRTVAELVYLTPVALLLGHAARFGFVAVLLGRWSAGACPRDLADLQRLDGAETLGGHWRAGRPDLVALLAAAAGIAFVLSLAEIPVTAQVRPPGFDSITATLLNDMHYQRPQAVMFAALVFLGAALGVAVLVAGLWGWLRGRARGARLVAPAAVLLLILPVGCVPEDSFAPRPLEARVVFGSPGTAPGQFNYPRGIAIDRARGRVFIVDKKARVQRFDEEGELELLWQMPESENGKPTGLNVGPDGRVYVADTHYFRVMVYDPEGTEVLRFGRYGEEPGAFIYPTDVEFGPEGRLYVSEYGGNDRIQVFTADGEYLFGFGSFGSEPGQFNRPQSMAFSEDGTELYIADACNHRIVVVDPRGRLLRMFGEPGRAPGQLGYPYDLTVLPDGTILVCEFGNNRLQRFAPDGASLGIFGRVGMGDGELQYPWGVDYAGDRVYVLDSGNNRVQVIRSPRSGA